METIEVVKQMQESPQFAQRVASAIGRVLSVVDDMATMRHELCEESIKTLDRKLREIRSARYAAESLEEKLRIMKDERDLERIRAERRKRLFELMDDGAIHAHSPLPRDELVALVEPLRDLLAAVELAEPSP